MQRQEWENPTEHRWALGIILAVLLQTAAFGFWCGQIQGTVHALVNTVAQLRTDLSQHMNATK